MDNNMEDNMDNNMDNNIKDTYLCGRYMDIGQ